MAEYIINWSDEGVPGKDPIRLAEKTKDTSSTSLTLTGRGTASYGEIQQENFIRLLENFAAPAAPVNSTIGQLWYDTASGSLKIKFGQNSSDWKNVNLLPSQAGNGNKYLRTDGSSLSWNAITAGDLLPGQAGNTGKVLTTDGSSLSWASALPNQSGKAGKFLKSDGTTSTWESITTDSSIATKEYVDTHDYLNFDPLAGVLDENKVPIYSDFKFSLGAANTQAFYLTDDQNFEVAYFHVNTPLGKVQPWRAYRFIQNQDFIFDSSALTVSFLGANEYVSSIMNIGTQFAYLEFTNSVTAAKRRVLAKTRGKSKSTTWTFFADVTSITDRWTNIFLLVDSAGDRILRTTLATNSSSVRLDVFDSALTLLRGQDVYVIADVTAADQTAAGRTSTNNTLPFAYFPPNCVPAFTWNKFTDNLLMVYSGWHVYSSGAVNQGVGFSLTISWNIPKSWFTDGSGTLSNLVPVKSSGFRYHKLPDTTWDSASGGLGLSGGGQAISTVTNEFAKILTVGRVGTWSTGGFHVYKLANQDWQTIGNNTASIFSQYVAIPDAAPWSKNIYSHSTHVVGDNIQFYAASNKYGSVLLNAKFSTNIFSSSSPAYPNDTLKLDPVAWQITPSPSGGNAYSTTADGSVALAYKIIPGSAVQEITVVDGVRTYTPTAFTLPALPSTIGSVTGITLGGPTVYNGNSANRKFWTLVASANRSLYIAEYSSGAWSNIYGPFLTTEIAAGNTNRGDSANSWSAPGCPLLTNNGRFISNFTVPVIGGAAYYILEYNVNTATATVHPWNKFSNPTPSAYGSTNPAWGRSIGYSSTLGYYATLSNNSIASATFFTSKDITGAGAELTEEQWFSGSVPRYQISYTTEPALGLFAYTKEYPLFIGGYYTSVTSENLALAPNSTQYIYAEKTNTSRDSLSITVGTDYFPDTFNRVALAQVITDSERVLSSTSYSINSKNNILPPQAGNANKFLSTNGTTAFWDDGGSIVISTTAPTSPTVGKVWYDNGSRGRAFIWTGDSWVDMSPGAAGGGGGSVGPTGPTGPVGPAGTGGSTTWTTGLAGTGSFLNGGYCRWYRSAAESSITPVFTIQTGRVKLTSPIPEAMRSYTPGGAGLAGTDFGGLVYFPRSFSDIHSVVVSGLGAPTSEGYSDNDFDGRMVGQFEYNWSQTSIAIYARRLIYDTPLVEGSYLTVSFVAYGLA